MKPFATYKLPLRSRTVRGKKYNIIALEEEDRWGVVKCREKCLVEPLKDLTIVFLADSRKPSTRSLWRTIHCFIVDDVYCLPYNVVYQKERYKKPLPTKLSDLGRDVIELKLSINEFNIDKYHSISIPNDLYRKFKEVDKCSQKQKKILRKK